MGFVNVKFLCLLGLVALIFILELAAAPSPWYEYKAVVTITEYLSHVESTLVGKFSCDWTDDKCGGDKLRAMWGMILTAVIISILLTAVETLILFTWAFDFCHKLKFRSKLRIPLIVIAFLASFFAFAAWLLLFWHPSALEDSINIKYDFVGDNSGPQAGWGLFVGASILSLIAAIILCMSGSPDHHGYKLFH
ncbi:uncharacterized protein ACA1_373540 [Acanthamoeba castellanii str. Neff]|uniref:Transmembrane protein n=1 Tax=Acanthamoeba castellanii (strain ATCC 30010 / Neff) TaxID=1257118 RepID=L8GJC3_ACACF|nr:uncharacterized protein ACA1_373540 [Acanthamoeba castellanii str. Neff]ELR12291.1 hypothetical protein ACA1_373540 [Acanthamoeba castellanii str. Neff]